LRVIVTGVAGFVGSHVAELLLKQGYEVIGLDNLSTGKLENVPKGVDLRIGNLDDIRNMPKADQVYHLAALARIPESIKNPVESHKTNVDGTLAVLEYCREHNAKIIFSSSCAVFDESDEALSEASSFNPKNPYAMQKMMCEQYIFLYWQLYKVNFVIMRYFNVFGERQPLDGAYAGVVGIFMKQKEKKEPLTITGDGEQKRDFIYVKDVAIANVILGKLSQGVYNVGFGQNWSVNEIAYTIGGEKYKQKHLPERKGEMRSTLCDNKLLMALGWKPSMTIIEWLEDYKVMQSNHQGNE
jgi:nucleoside-diphosphate-sugar epimerase